MKTKLAIKMLVLVTFLLSSAVMVWAINPHGKPQSKDLGYRVWKDGGTWNLRMEAKEEKRHFDGTISCKGNGRITDAWALDMEKRKDQGGWNEREIQFEFKSQEGKDGISWTGTCDSFEFDLKIDGGRKANRVWIGGDSKNPDDIPFKLNND